MNRLYCSAQKKYYELEFRAGVEHRHKIVYYCIIFDSEYVSYFQIIETSVQMDDIIKYSITYNSEKTDVFSREMRLFQDFDLKSFIEIVSPVLVARILIPVRINS